MGSDAIALPALNWLTGAGRGVAEIVGVFTQPDRAVGRGQKIQPNEIKLWAQARGIPVYQPEKFGPTDEQQLAALKPDLTLVMAYGHILKQAVIATPSLGTLNLHTSILPKYRGASPIQTAVASGETETGVTLMRIVPELDAGPVADVERVPISPRDTALEIEAKLAEACVPLLARALPKIISSEQGFADQVGADATFCRKLHKHDGVLDFTSSAGVLAARINGLMPWPACTIDLDGQPVKVGLADALSDGGKIGEVLGTDAEGLLIGTGQGTLRVLKLQRAGGRMLPALEFLRGSPVAAGTEVVSKPMPALVGREPFPRLKS